MNGFKQLYLPQVIKMATLSVAVAATSPVYASAQVAEELMTEEIIVTSIRSSIKRAEDIKKNSRNIVEAISSEDLGKFSDDSIAESLQRLPGVQIEEDVMGSAGDKVSIRGLGSQFVVATVNGRTAWSSGDGEGRELRSFNFSTIPSEVVNEVLVTKTPVADTIESGIGGSVDVRTLRPLEADYGDDNWIAQVEARAQARDIGDQDFGPRISGVFGAKNEAGNMGGYVAFNASNLDSGNDRQEVRYRDNREFYIDHNDNFVADADELYDGATTIRDVLFSSNRTELERGAVTAAFQYEPTDQLSLVADVMYTKADSVNRRPNTRFDFDRFISRTNDILFAPDAIELADGGLGDEPYHTTYIDQNGIRCNGTDQDASCARNNGRLLAMRDQYRNNFRDSWIGGLNLKYENGPWTVTGDVFYNKLDTEVHETSIDANTYNLGGAITADMRGGEHIVVDYDVADLAHDNFEARRLRIRQRENIGDQTGARIDFDFKVDSGIVESVQFGARYNTSDFSYIKSQRASWTDGGADQAAFDAAMYGTGFHDAVFGVALPMFDLASTREYLMGVGLPADVDGGSEFGPCQAGNVGDYLSVTGKPAKMLTDSCIELANSFNVSEDTYSVYGAINLSGEIAGKPAFANIGLRYVNTDNSSVGVVAVSLDGDDVQPDPSDTVYNSGSFDKVLPNINLRLDLTDAVQLRFAASETLSRPDLYDLTSRFQVSASDDVDDDVFTPEDCLNGGCVIKQGNPSLEPYTAWNYDLTVMWSMPTDGFLAASVYHKDIDNFIFDQVSGPITLPEYGVAEFSVVQPSNASSAKVTGYEVAIHQPFTFLPAPFDGFGVQANYSYTDSEFAADLPADVAAIFGSFGLPGASPHNYNAVFYYEKDKFSARVGYVYRDTYFSSFNGGAEGQPRFFDEEERVSASATYDINDSVQLRLQGSNLTEDGRREFTTFQTQTARYTTNPRSYSIGIRAKF